MFEDGVVGNYDPRQGLFGCTELIPTRIWVIPSRPPKSHRGPNPVTLKPNNLRGRGAVKVGEMNELDEPVTEEMSLGRQRSADAVAGHGPLRRQ
jgi:hypothetical protein